MNNIEIQIINFDHQLSLSKSKYLYSNNGLQFLKRAVPLTNINGCKSHKRMAVKTKTVVHATYKQIFTVATSKKALQGRKRLSKGWKFTVLDGFYSLLITIIHRDGFIEGSSLNICIYKTSITLMIVKAINVRL